MRSPLALAALATVAVPGLDAVDVRRPRNPSSGVDAAVVIDAQGRRWVVRAPQTPMAGAALEAESALLVGLAAHVDAGHVPFDVPRPAGFVELPEGGRAVVHPQLPGKALHLERLGPGPGLAAEVGRAIAAVHELPPSVVEDAGLPVYEADEYRRRRLAEVDEAARTGRVPASLLRRWERALEDVAVWRFRPVVVHGDLSADHILCSAATPVAVLGWSEAKVADPADDLAWLLVAAPHEAVDAILEAYNLRRTELRDPHLQTRALLAGELALARWLLHGVHTGDQAIVDDATAMLADLAEHAAAEEAAEARVAAGTVPADADGGDPGYEPDAGSEGRDADGIAAAGIDADGIDADEPAAAGPDDLPADGDAIEPTDGPTAVDPAAESAAESAAADEVAGDVDADEPTDASADEPSDPPADDDDEPQPA